MCFILRDDIRIVWSLFDDVDSELSLGCSLPSVHSSPVVRSELAISASVPGDGFHDLPGEGYSEFG